MFSFSVDLINHHFQHFCGQNLEDGHFDVTFQFGMTTDFEGNYVNNENEPIQQLHVHSFILWPFSKVFERSLFGPLAHKGPIPIIRHSFDDFKEFITFLYLGNCTITMNNVMALVDLGEYYEVKLLKDQCDAFLSENSTKIENVLKVYESLKIYSLENAMKKVMEFVAGNTVEILKTDEFLGAKKETVLDIVKMKNLTAKQEELFEAICKWGDYNCPEDTVNKNDYLKNLLADFIPLIDFGNMELSFLNKFVVRKAFLFSSFDALSDALCEATTKKQKAEEELLKNVPRTKRIQFTNGTGYTAYADICDPNVITALETSNTNLPMPGATSDSCQWQMNIEHRANSNPKFRLIRDSSGLLTLKTNYIHNSNSQCCVEYKLENENIDYSEGYYPSGYYPNGNIPYNYYPSGYYLEDDECDNLGCPQRKIYVEDKEEIIAPVFSLHPNFRIDQKCKIEFV